MAEIIGGLSYVDAVGSIGTFLVVAAYFATQARMLNSNDPAFPIINLVGSLLIACSLYFHFNLASVLMEFFWITISGMGIVRGFKEWRTVSKHQAGLTAPGRGRVPE